VLSTVQIVPQLGINFRDIDVFQVRRVVDHVEHETAGSDEVG
jgi:hypothetical protein